MSKGMGLSRWTLLGVAVVMLLGALFTAQQIRAHVGGPEADVIHSCVNDLSGVIFITDSLDECKGKTSPLDWNAQGIQGDPGDKGDQGIQGDPGAAGPVGPKGDQGDQGIQGVKGNTGAKGDKGDIGSSGPKGDKGDKGDQGEQGPQGDPGDAVKADPPCFDNANRYVDCGNGTVTDTVTGLIWLANANCFGREEYADANTMAAGLADGQCGLTDGSTAGDWRLATVEEWQTTIARAVALGCTRAGAGNPPTWTNTAGTACFDTEVSPVFSNVLASNYWSSSADASAPNSAQNATLAQGATFLLTKDFPTPIFSWPVRGGP